MTQHLFVIRQFVSIVVII